MQRILIILIVCMVQPCIAEAGREKGVCRLEKAMPSTAYLFPEIPDENLLKKLHQRLTRIKSKLEKQAAQAWSKYRRTVKQTGMAGILEDSTRQYPASRLPDSRSLDDYIAVLDSIGTAMTFFQTSGMLTGATIGSGSPVPEALQTTIRDVQQALGQSIFIQKQIAIHQEALKQKLLQSGMLSTYRSLERQGYELQEQIKMYKKELSSVEGATRRLLSMARNTPTFQQFMREHGQLVSLLGINGTGNGAIPLAGLQTRAAVQQNITQLPGGNGMSIVATQLQEADNALNTLRTELNQRTGETGTLRSFKPNSQRTKTWWQRMEWSVNLQSQKSNGLLPVSTDMGLMAGYKLNDKSSIGVGVSYKIGWGKSLDHIRLTHEGIGLRTYADMRIKGSIWLSGGYEWNYQSSFRRLRDLGPLSLWQRSGLIGLAKKYKLGKKEGNLQVFWDFLSSEQVPATPALKFRVGYRL